MLEDAKKHLLESGQFQTVQNLAELLSVDVDYLESRLKERKSQRKIFSIDDGSAGELFPIFALDRRRNLCPYDALAEVVDIFEKMVSKWFIASWFIGICSYLDDQCPKDLLGVDPEWVIEAARDEIRECTHGCELSFFES